MAGKRPTPRTAPTPITPPCGLPDSRTGEARIDCDDQTVNLRQPSYWPLHLDDHDLIRANEVLHGCTTALGAPDYTMSCPQNLAFGQPALFGSSGIQGNPPAIDAPDST